MLRSDVEINFQAERAAIFQSRHISEQDLLTARKAYENLEAKLTDEAAPFQDLFERNVGEVDTVLKADHLTMVTSFALGDDSMRFAPAVDLISFFVLRHDREEAQHHYAMGFRVPETAIPDDGRLLLELA